MVLLVCPTYCRLHFVHVRQYIKLELLQVMLVLHSCSTNVAVHFIFPLVLSLGQYRHCFFAIHLFLSMVLVFIMVNDLDLFGVLSGVWLTIVSEVLAWISPLLERNSLKVGCLRGPPAMGLVGKISDLTFLGVFDVSVGAFGALILTSALTIRSLRFLGLL